MKKSKLTALLMTAVLFTVPLAACGNSSTTAKTPPTSEANTVKSSEASTEKPMMTATETEKKSGSYSIAFVAKDNVSAWFARTKDGVVKFAKDTGVDAFQVAPEAVDAAQEVQVIEDLIAQGVDAITLYSIDPSTLEPVLAKARAAGIKVVTCEAMTQKSKDYDIEPFDPANYGAQLMDALASEMGGKGKYCTMVSYVTNISHNQWADGAVARQKSTYPGLELISGSDARVESQDNTEKAYEVTKELLKKYPDLKGFIGTSSNDVPGISRAIEELGLSGKVFVSGTGVPSLIEPYLKSGTLQKAYLWDPSNNIYGALMIAYQMLEGNKISDGMDLKCDGFNKISVDAKDPTIFYGTGIVEITKDNVRNLGFFF